tara:strand:- start:1147 stop:1710 length:564 start_codon:yes stop_codon:yes gene_type:complete
MNLLYNIPDRLWVINNFLDYSTYKDLHSIIIKNREDFKIEKTNKGISPWDKKLYEFIEAPSHSKKTLYPEHPSFKKLEVLTKHNPYFSYPRLIYAKGNSMIHYMTKNTGIQWHDDHGYKYGITYYLNRRWDENWGGEFLFKDTEKGIHGFVPVAGNRLIIIKAPFTHKVNLVNSLHMPRISIQMFLK